MIGRTIAHYQVLGRLGAGGMGVVYRARDTRLGRDVAIKVLPTDFAQDRGRLARFEREARVLAALSHANIGAIYGLEEADGKRFLILELVEGETLAERIKRGPIPVPEALELARQIADALEAAHDRGIIHRDLKPGNIQLTPDGVAKVLDFGLAKPLGLKGASSVDFARSPTLTAEATETGAILGTASYMSPEQVRGLPVDERTDIWAFGCVLYEVLTASRVFPGKTAGDTAAAILEHEPDWSLLPATLSRQVRVLLERCLRKDLKKRLRHIADARIELEDTQSEAPVAIPDRKSSLRPLLAWSLVALAGLVAAIGVWTSWPSAPRESASPSRWVITLPEDQRLLFHFSSSIALSPDGERLVYAAASKEGGSQLYRRELDSFTASPVEGTNGAGTPFFSPDGEWLGFFAQGKLWKVPIEGGPPVPICDAARVPTGATWGADDTIIFTVFGSGLLRVPAQGGEPEALTAIDTDSGELGHQWPQILPDDHGVLFGSVSGGVHRVLVLSLETGERRRVFDGSSMARYVPTGHLVYQGSGGLWTVPFDLPRLKADGSRAQFIGEASRQFAFSKSGSLVYAASPVTDRKLVWVDRKGNSTPLMDVEASFNHPRLSPDERLLAVDTGPAALWTAQHVVWVHNLEGGTRTPLATEGGNSLPVWTPDGSRIAFSSGRSEGSIDIYWKPADGSEEAETLVAKEPYPQAPMSWSNDGEYLVFWELHPERGGDIWVLSLTGDHATSPVIASEFDESWARISPDDEWLAYVSTESGRPEVYVQPFPAAGDKRLVSSGGGAHPVWSPDGRELFYLGPEGQMMVVPIKTEPNLSAGAPQLLFEGAFVGSFDVSRDGRRFVMTQEVQDSRRSRTELHFVLNWFRELESLAGAREGG